MTHEEINKPKTYPVLKWAGGKRQLLPDLLNNLPKTFNNYYEPFVGAGALFFELQPSNAHISDVNPELINLYKIIKDDANALINDLKKHKNNEEYFYEMRNLDRTPEYKELSNIQKASRFIYLNKTCFNGLYRVNSRGEFNVPFGKYSNPKIIDEINLLNCSKLLKNTEIQNESFTEIINKVKKNDFVYFDPPYMPVSQTSNFTSYTKDSFDINMQIKLKELCDELNERGVYFLLSNSDVLFINEIYSSYEIKKVFAGRAINSEGSKRGKITEVLIKNY